MQVYELLSVLKGENTLLLDKASAEAAGIKEEPREMCRHDFYCKYRKTAVYMCSVENVRTKVTAGNAPNSYATLLIIELNKDDAKTWAKACAPAK